MGDIVDRLRGKYRVPITDGYGHAGGDEPDNATEFVRTFQTPPIQHEAADEIERLRANLGRMLFIADGVPLTGIEASQWIDEARAALNGKEG